MEGAMARRHGGAKERRRGALHTVGALLAVLLTLIASIVLLAWLTGRLASDRFLWSQWLLWIPTPVALIAAALGMVGSLRPAKRNRTRTRRALAWAVVGIAVGVHFAFFEHRLFAGAEENQDGLRLVHWNMTHLQYGDNDRHVEQVIAMNGDVTVLTNAGPARYDRRFVAWLGDSYHSLTLGPFTVLSRHPITSSTVLGDEDLINVASITVEVADEASREISILMIDLPSDPYVRRSELAVAVRRLLEDSQAPPSDIVLGDFNLTRGSTSLKRMFPQMHHAYDDAGRGLGASFPRRRPIVHIDHVLLAEELRATAYRLVNPGVSRHRAQIAHVVGR